MKKSVWFFRHLKAWGSLLLVMLCLSAPISPVAFAQDNPADIFAELQVMRLDEPLPAPTFSLPAVDGGMHKLEDYRGKLVLLNFWTTW